MGKNIRVGVVGCGAIAPLHLEAIEQIPGVNLQYVCDKDMDRASKTAKRYQCQYVTDYKELLTKNLDVIHILTPHYLHMPMAIEALECGKHVILEKPIAITLEQCQMLQAAQMKSIGTINVILQNRYNPTSLYLKQAAESGIYGAMKAMKGIVAWNRSDVYYTDSDWRGNWSTEGGGLLINQALHTLDLMQWIGGPIKFIKGHIDNYNHPYIEVEDTAVVMMEYENSAIGSFYGTNNHGINSNIELEVVFETATFTQMNEELWITKQNSPKELVACNRTAMGEKGYWGVGHKQCIKTAYSHIEQGLPPAISIDDAFPVHELIFNLYEYMNDAFAPLHPICINEISQ
ncbi:MAG TPA: Gfo/Idh/MocA family oxidoreductase [Lachnospiraceae bacterium]|nr:Gfo/Idh/MocA family oxidoreductase [Lachnospiraceae bacterium]